MRDRSAKATKAPSYLDVVAAMCAPKQRLTHVRAMRPHPSRKTLLRAARDLAARGAKNEAKQILAFAEEVFPPRPPSRLAKMGYAETRMYSAQEGRTRGTGDVMRVWTHVRVPTDLFGLAKQDEVAVRFEATVDDLRKWLDELEDAGDGFFVGWVPKRKVDG